MIQDMELRSLKENTQKAYVDAVKDLARHYNRSPDLLSEEELRRYFVNLTKVRRCSKSTLRIRLFGIKFLFRYTLRRPLPVFDLIRLGRDRKLPTVLSRQEVRQVLTCIRRPAARMSALVMYSCGLRVTAATRLRAADIDSRRMMVCVRNGKGSKDQYVPLPQRTLELLRAYWREHRPQHWLLTPSNLPLFMQHFLKRPAASARARIVAAELLDELLVAVDDAAAASHGSFGGETLSGACSSAQKQLSSLTSSILCMVHLLPAGPARSGRTTRRGHGIGRPDGRPAGWVRKASAARPDHPGRRRLDLFSCSHSHHASLLPLDAQTGCYATGT
jgi:hypothetical protein